MSDADEVTCARFALGEFAVEPRPLADERPPGLLAERYEVGRLVGSGGTARVYRAYDLRLNREVAVKIYDRDAVALDQRRRLREMSIQGSITHPGVVALLDSGTEHGRTYLVMQLVEGENLAERLLTGPLPPGEVIELAGGLAEALAHVHARRIVHRDLKPANVFLSATGPLIGDFGIAHALDTTHITGTGVVPGTAAYLAPEQVSGEPASPSADVYALGLILLECVTGHREYPGTMVEAAMARLTRAPRIPDGLPPSLAHTLRRMTRREPADRPTALEVRQLLHTPVPTLPWAAGPFAPTGDSSPTDTAAHAPHRAGPRRRILAAVGLSSSGDPAHRRRFTAAAGLTAAAVAAVSAMLLAAQEPGTSTPAQPPAPNSPVATATPSSSAPDSTTSQPAANETADLEPAAVTHQSRPAPQPPAKPANPNRTRNHGKGKGPGHDS
ncbi:protein kinase domain-containing protein [Amycolatopsis sp. NPDC004378]